MKEFVKLCKIPIWMLVSNPARWTILLMNRKSTHQPGPQTQAIHGGEPYRRTECPFEDEAKNLVSPDTAGGLVHHFLSFVASEGSPEFRAVGDYVVYAVPGIGVRVGED
jgi:hypothetical protein